jgi:hypothetical protein
VCDLCVLCVTSVCVVCVVIDPVMLCDVCVCAVRGDGPIYTLYVQM